MSDDRRVKLVTRALCQRIGRNPAAYVETFFVDWTNDARAILAALDADEREREATDDEELEAYRDAAQYDAMMEELRFKGWNRSQLDRARALTEKAIRNINPRDAIKTSKWRLVGTAPRDGRTIVLWDGEEPVTAHWDSFGGGSWKVHRYDDETDHTKITHWMPVPEPPSLDAAGGGEGA